MDASEQVQQLALRGRYRDRGQAGRGAFIASRPRARGPARAAAARCTHRPPSTARSLIDATASRSSRLISASGTARPAERRTVAILRPGCTAARTVPDVRRHRRDGMVEVIDEHGEAPEARRTVSAAGALDDILGLLHELEDLAPDAGRTPAAERPRASAPRAHGAGRARLRAAPRRCARARATSRRCGRSRRRRWRAPTRRPRPLARRAPSAARRAPCSSRSRSAQPTIPRCPPPSRKRISTPPRRSSRRRRRRSRARPSARARRRASSSCKRRRGPHLRATRLRVCGRSGEEPHLADVPRAIPSRPRSGTRAARCDNCASAQPRVSPAVEGHERPIRRSLYLMPRLSTTALDAQNATPELDRYRTHAPFLDELFDDDGTPRATAAPLVAELRRLGPEGLIEAGRRRDAIFMQQGITFETSGGGGGSHERPFPLDLVPRVLSGEEWRDIKRGLAQRIRALNHFVDDVYHAREIVREGLVPWRLVASCPHFARAVHGIRPPGGVYTHVAGCDLVRHSDGSWKVIEDNVRIPSGISYVLENRAAMARLVPELFASYRVRPVDHYPQLLLRRAALGRAVGRERGDGRRVDAGPGQPRVLRARLPRAADGRRAGRGLGPGRARRRPLHAHHARARARARRLPPPRRRLRRPARVPRRLAARRARARARLPRGQRRDRQRVRHRRRRRQGDLLLRAGDDPLLPRRGADPRERAHLPAVGPGGARARARAPRPSWWSSRPASPAGAA